MRRSAGNSNLANTVFANPRTDEEQRAAAYEEKHPQPDPSVGLSIDHSDHLEAKEPSSPPPSSHY